MGGGLLATAAVGGGLGALLMVSGKFGGLWLLFAAVIVWNAGLLLRERVVYCGQCRRHF
jgi:hypothetical protein